MKTKTGRQSKAQENFQRFFEASGGKYIIIRSFEDFQTAVSEYMRCVPLAVTDRVKDTWHAIDAEQTAEAKRKLEKLINKKQ